MKKGCRSRHLVFVCFFCLLFKLSPRHREREGEGRERVGSKKGDSAWSVGYACRNSLKGEKLREREGDGEAVCMRVMMCFLKYSFWREGNE